MNRGVLISIAVLVLLPMTASADEPAAKKIPAPAPVQVSCDVVEIWASHGKATIDPAIPKQLASRLTNNFKWTEYKQLSSVTKTIEKKKPEAVKLAKGSATVTLVEIVDKSQVRLTVGFNAAKGASTQTQLVAAGDWVTTAVNQSKEPNADAHLLAVSCK